MNTNLKNAIRSVTGYIFPIGSRETEKLKSHGVSSAYEYVSNLPLQMVLYFNAFYAPFWLIGALLALTIEIHRLDAIYQVINTAIVCLYAVVEGPRIYLGFSGNLMESVPELVGSWLLTVLIQLPAICFMLFNPFMLISPFERSLHSFEFIFIFLEAIIGFFVINILVQHQAIKFQMHLQSKNKRSSAPTKWNKTH
ncbi:unnamed protein product [Calicophoron daubneyi]|uniref:Transmembrane protein 17 n=1 Tax=Calicophoron daubneyi TaxID=300641 RepID=A0AAV2TS40_CALDB